MVVFGGFILPAVKEFPEYGKLLGLRVKLPIIENQVAKNMQNSMEIEATQGTPKPLNPKPRRLVEFRAMGILQY